MARNRPPIHHERRRRAADLRMLADTLARIGACEDVSPLQAAAYQCEADGSREPRWTYDVSQLLFRAPTFPGHRPIDVDGLMVTVNVSADGHIRETASDADPLRSLAVDIVLTGTRRGSSNATAAWHFDRETGQPGESSNAVHPRYHVQYGGNRMKDLQLGETLLGDAPRLLHPPLDAVLAIDFVASNFLYERWQRLRDDQTYRRIVADSYAALWTPWFECVSAHWRAGGHLRWNEASLLCPMLLEPAPPAEVGVTQSRRRMAT
jgi:hypothetical protein